MYLHRQAPCPALLHDHSCDSESMRKSLQINHLLVFAFACLVFGNRAGATVGATIPFTSFEAENGVLGGSALIQSLTAAPTTPYSSPQLEASGHAFVQLTNTGQSVTWTNTTGQSFTAINVRSCIPD